MTEPTVQRVGSGRSARVSAMVAVLLIGVVAWFGFAGREARPPASSLPPVADASPSGSAVPTLTTEPTPGTPPGLIAEEPATETPAAIAQEPRLEARLQNDGRLTARIGLGGALPGVMTAHVIAHERDGASPQLELVRLDGASVQLLASQGLQMRELRRGYPEELVGVFTVSSAGDEEQTWRYRITPHGTGSGVMLLVEAEPLADVPLTCWSNGELC